MSLRRGWLLAGAAIAALCLASTPAVRADAVFSYATTVTPASIGSGAGSSVSEAAVSSGTNGVPSTILTTTGGTDITVGTLTISDDGLGNSYNDHYSTAISIGLTLSNVGPPGVAATGTTMTFTGTVTGNVFSNGTSFGSSFSNPFAFQSQSQTIGGVKYTVVVEVLPQGTLNNAFNAPGPPVAGGQGKAGTYVFHVTAAPVPEPASASLALAGIGSLVVVGLIRRRRRAQA